MRSHLWKSQCAATFTLALTSNVRQYWCLEETTPQAAMTAGLKSLVKNGINDLSQANTIIVVVQFKTKDITK